MSLLSELGVTSPLWITVGTASVVLLLTVAGGPKRPAPEAGTHLTVVSLAGLLAAALVLWQRIGGETQQAFSGAILVDGLGITFSLIALLGAAVAVIFATSYLREHGLSQGEFLALLLLSTSGMLIVAMAGDLMTFFIGIEIMSIAVYVLSGYRRSSRRSQEAAIKYFIYGAFASGFLIFGIALLYGEVGRLTGTPSLGYTALAQALSKGGLSHLGWLAAGLVLGGLAFKVAAVPFHMWAPDVYEGAPTPATGFMAVGIKAAAFAGMARFVGVVMLHGDGDRETLVQVFEVLAMATMLVGNLMAIRQTQIKRMLAYSSVAHAGYVLVGIAAFVAAPESNALEAVAFYLFAYTLMTLGAFGVVLAFERREDRRLDLAIDRLRGAGHRYPALGLAMAIFMFSLTGVPPTAGFFGKLSLFAAAVNAGRVGVVVVAVIASAIGAYYYLNVLVALYMRATDTHEQRVKNAWLAAGLWICALTTLVAGALPDLAMDVARQLLAGWFEA